METVSKFESKLTNCFVKSRPSKRGECLFHENENGDTLVHLDRYAIIPIEEYQEIQTELEKVRELNKQLLFCNEELSRARDSMELKLKDKYAMPEKLKAALDNPEQD